MAIFRKFANIKIANINNYAHTHIDEETWEEKCGSSNCQYENCSQTNLSNITFTNESSCLVFFFGLQKFFNNKPSTNSLSVHLQTFWIFWIHADTFQFSNDLHKLLQSYKLEEYRTLRGEAWLSS